MAVFKTRKKESWEIDLSISECDCGAKESLNWIGRSDNIFCDSCNRTYEFNGCSVIETTNEEN